LSKGSSDLPCGVQARVNDGVNILIIPDILFFEASDCLMMVRKESAVSNRVLLRKGEVRWKFMDKDVSVKVVDELNVRKR
jgi:hypothetical protein